MMAELQADSWAPLVCHEELGAVDGLYVHVPFCYRKCHYCDFYIVVDRSAAAEENRQAAFTDALITELEHYFRQFESRLTTDREGRRGRNSLRPRTIYIGGGTPTLLRLQLWQRLLETLRGFGALDQVEEFTVEANPETVTSELMSMLVAGGVNRISLGAQTFQPQLLVTLGRWHNPQSITTAIGMARSAGVENVSLDLIWATPGQTLAMLESDLERVLALEPQHLSCYNLTYEEGTAMTAHRRQGQVTPISESLEAVMYERILERLNSDGFEHYEISNWARRVPRNELQGTRLTSQTDPGQDKAIPPRNDPSPYRCAHNLIYWTNGNWVGVGPSAASHIDGIRWKNEPHLGRYIAGSPHPQSVDRECLSPERRIGEQLMLGLRMREGVEWTWLVENLTRTDQRWATIDQLRVLGMLEHSDDRLRLTHKGLFVSDSIISKLL